MSMGPGSKPRSLEITPSLPLTTEEVAIGNPGFRHYRYRVTWKDDTVVRTEPLHNEYATGYSDFDEKQVPVFYGKDGPGPLYQREHFLKEAKPELSPLHMDDGSLDFWAGLEKPASRM